MYGLCLSPCSIYPSAESPPSIVEPKVSWYWVTKQMDKQAMEKIREYYISTAPEMQFPVPSQHRIVVEWVGLCRLCGGDHYEGCAQNVQLRLNNRLPGRGYFPRCIWIGNHEGFSGNRLSLTKEEKALRFASVSGVCACLLFGD